MTDQQGWARQVQAESDVIDYLAQKTDDRAEGGEGLKTLMLRSADRLHLIAEAMKGNREKENVESG